MKARKLSLLGVLAVAFSLQSFSQDLPEVTVIGIKYKYLSAVSKNEVAQPVKMLQKRAAEYNIKSSEFYEEDYDNYFVSFYIPEGQILAEYDKNGKLLSTVERYTNVQLPKTIVTSVTSRFPQWSISKDVYKVNYQEAKENTSKVYKLTLENGDKRLKIKVNEKGEFI